LITKSYGPVYDRDVPYRVLPAPPPKIPDGPDHIGAAQRLARRNRRFGLVTVAVVGAVVVASVLVHNAHRKKQQEAFDGAKADLEACLVGPEPLATGGPLACGLRVRRRQLTAMGTPVERRIDEALGGWPMRCSEASKRMMRQAIELEDLTLQHEADRATARLATMKAMSAPLDLPLCVDAGGNARAPRLSRAAADSLPALAAPLDLDALVAHGGPALAARNAKVLEADPKLAALVPEGHREVGSFSAKETEPPKLPDGESTRVDVDWPGVIHLATCEGGKCQKRIVSRETFDLNDPELRASDSERFRPARLGGAVLAVWRAGTRGGLRMRLAPIDRLAATRDVVVYDDLVREGVLQGTTTLDSFRVYGGAHAARIFLVTPQGTWIVDVSESGALSFR
jgi:hypothetical protein